jgi:DNA-binding transcriptional regulator YiaG
MAAKSKTAKARLLSGAAFTDFIKLTPLQSVRLGFAPTTERYVRKTLKVFRRNTSSIAKRQYQKLQSGVSLERRAKEIAAGLRVSKHTEHAEQRLSKIAAYDREIAMLPPNPTAAEIDAARRRAGLSEAQFERYRREGRSSTLAWEKREGDRRWRFRGAKSFVHTFINADGDVQHAEFSGIGLTAMQDYRSAVDFRSASALDEWAKKHPNGVMTDGGERVFPETNIAKLNRTLKEMPSRSRRLFERDVHYAVETA